MQKALKDPLSHQHETAPAEVDNPRLGRKLAERRFRWRWNVRLGIMTLIALLVAATASYVSYTYHSSTVADTFQQRAKQAIENDDYEGQLKWLRRYSMLRPDDVDAVVQLGIAADEAANLADRDDLLKALSTARQQLSSSIAQLGDFESVEEEVADLRIRLIERLLQLGGPWYVEAERQILLSQADAEDPRATKWLALALYGQLTSDAYKERDVRDAPATDYWTRLAYQPLGEILSLAVTRNPADLDVLAPYVLTYASHPHLFDQSAIRAAEHQSQVDAALTELLLQETSRGQLVVFAYAQARDESDRAEEILRESAPQAFNRLSEVSPSDLNSDRGTQIPPFVWDYRILFQAAQTISEDNPELAATWYAKLMETESKLVPIDLVEGVFASAGQLQLTLSNRNEAIRTWEVGLEQVGPNSLTLRGAIAIYRTIEESDEGAADAIEAFRDAIEAAAARLARDTQIDKAVQTAIGRQLAAAKWRLNLVDGLYALRQQDEAKALQHLNEAMASTADIPIQDRILLASKLAEVFGRRGDWDQAAVTLDSAIELDPKDQTLRVRAADAWTRAGNKLRAVEHWRALGSSDSVVIQVARAEALFQQQLQVAPDSRDFSGIRSDIRRLVDQLRLTLEDATDDGSRDMIRAALARVGILNASLPPQGTALEDYLESDEFANQILTLSAKNPTDVSVQTFAAERLASIGRKTEAEQSLTRLGEMLGQDSPAFAIIRARIEAEAGDPASASVQLEKQAALQPEQSRVFLRAAFAFAQMAKQPERAYRLLAAIPESQRQVLDLFELATTARGLPVESPFLKLNDKSVSSDQLSEHWEEEIWKKDGRNSTYALWLQATRILAELQRNPNEIDRNDPRLAEAGHLVRRILAQRPRWGEAISLDGWISSLQNRNELAIDQLRRGIEAGDGRLQTQLLLIQQLLASGRDEEAETQLRFLSTATDNAIDQYGETRIAIAARRGEIDRALSMARSSVQDRPNDYLAHVVLARTAISMANLDSKRREESLDEARTAINRAREVAGKDELPILVTLIQLLIANSDFDGVSNLKTEIAEGTLDEYSKAVLQSRCLLFLKEFDQAEEMLMRADQLRPTAQTQLSLARLYRQTGDTNAEIESLRKAQQRSADNAELRAQLARALAARDGNKVNWAELSALLADESTSTVSNRLLHAMLLGTLGNPDQVNEACRMLRELAAERNQRSEDASRVLAGLLRKQFEESGESQDSILGKRRISEIQSLYTALSERPEPAPIDLYRYADFLLSLEDNTLLPRIELLIEQLDRIDGGGVATLDIRVRFAQRTGVDTSGTPEIVKKWAEARTTSGMQADEDIATAAGTSLIRNGFVEEGIHWFEKAYENNPEKMLQTYLIVLSSEKRFEKCVQVSSEHYEKHHDSESAILLAESLMSLPGPLSDSQKLAIEDATNRHSDKAQVLESIATLQMLREEYDQAIRLFQRIRELDPFKIRTLNNLAMAYSQVPGRAAEGLEPINLAIKFAGEVPELLDTKGTVLMKSGRLEEALELFRQAVVKSDEPRYQFHVLLTLIEQGKTIEASRAWKNLNLEQLRPDGLTAAEQRRLEQLKKDFDPQPQRS